MTVTFQLPCLRSNYTNKPEHYISHLVGHEGPGSLLSALKVSRAQLSEPIGVGECRDGTGRAPNLLLGALKVSRVELGSIECCEPCL